MMARFNHERAASALVDAAYMGDKKAADRYGVTARSIRNWRERLDEDAHFSAIFREKKVLADQEWASELPSAIRSAIRFVRESAKESKLGDPRATSVVADALKILAEVALTREILDARLAGQDRSPNQED